MVPGMPSNSSSTHAAGIGEDLLNYLQQSRDGVLRGLDGLGEYDARRPLTPSGSNVLGLVKHLTGCELLYLGDCVGRPAALRLPWVEDGSIWEGADMWVSAEQSRADIVGWYQQACAHSDRSVTELALDTPAHVPHWPAEHADTTLGRLLVRMVAETAQHAGQIDILRESVDGRGGADQDEIGDQAFWARYVARIEQAAAPFR